MRMSVVCAMNIGLTSFISWIEKVLTVRGCEPELMLSNMAKGITNYEKMGLA